MKRINVIFLSLVTLLFSSGVFADECASVQLAFEEERYSSALRYLEPLLKNGEICAYYYKGMMLSKGYGIKLDQKAGIPMIELAAKKGYEPAKEFLQSYY